MDYKITHQPEQKLFKTEVDGRTAFVEYRLLGDCLLYTSPSPRDRTRSRMPSSA